MEYLKAIGCVNALLRASLISTVSDANCRARVYCVNALLRASLISTKISIFHGIFKKLCRPSSGFSHFYFKKGDMNMAEGGCQCPSSGFSHFYGNYGDCQHLRIRVSMPFFGLLSFLLGTTVTGKAKTFTCQCPSSGFFLFYSTLRNPPIYKPSRPHFRK